MSRERKKPTNATWQNLNDLSLDDSLEAEIPPFSYTEDEVDMAGMADASPVRRGVIDHALAPDEIEADALPEPEPFFTRFEVLRHFGQQISPILAPLLFGGLTFLFILPLVLNGHAYLHRELLWPIGLVLVALAVLQGTMLYYVSTNNVFWSLGIITGFLLFLLVGCFAVFGPLATGILFIVLLIASIVTIRLFMHPVPEGSVDIVYSFGKYSRTLYPGLNFLLPWEWVDSHLQTRERQWTCPEQTVPVSRDEDVHLKASISYQLMAEDAYLAVVQVEKWEESLQDLFISCLQTMSNRLKPEDFLAWPDRASSRPLSNVRLSDPEDEELSRWEHLNIQLFQRMRDKVALWGVLINWVQIRDITLTPHSSIAYNSNPIANIRTADLDTTATAPIQPPQTQASRRKMASDTTGRMEAPPVQPVTPTTPAAPPVSINTPEGASTPAAAKLPKEEALILAYKQIQNGKITSPETIRRIAAGFQAIANDPEASKNASFDAARAAQTLYDRAELYEEQASMSADFDDNDMPTQPDWHYSHPPYEDNRTAGG